MAVMPDGSRKDLQPPVSFRDRQKGLFSTKRRIRNFVETDEGRRLIPQDGHLVWSLHYNTWRQREESALTLKTPEGKGGADD